MTTDTSERGLERLICVALTGNPCDPPKPGEVREPSRSYGGSGWYRGYADDYDREYCVDLAQLEAFFRATRPALVRKANPTWRSPVGCPCSGSTARSRAGHACPH